MPAFNPTKAQIQRLAILLAQLPVAMMTNPNAEGVLLSRPMWLLEIDAAGCLWFFTTLKSTKMGFVPQVNVSFSDHTRATYVSLTGHCELNTDVATRTRLWTPKAKTWFPEGPESPKLALLKFIPASADYWSSPHCKVVHLFGTASTTVASKVKSIDEVILDSVIS